jgi:hypothetical protein
LYTLAINLHGGWIQLPVMLLVVGGALVATEARRRWVGTGATSHLSIRCLAMVVGACSLALLIQPYGPRLLYFPLEMQADWIREGYEWQSPWMNPVWQKVGGGLVVSMEPVFWVYTAVLVGVLLMTIRRWRAADLVPLAVMGFWLGMSLWHLRAVSDAALLTSPFLAAALPSWRVWPVGVALTLGVAALSLPHTVKAWEWHLDAPQLSCLVAAFDRHGLSGRVYSDIESWLLYRFSPRVRVGSTWEFVAGPQRWPEIRRGKEWPRLPAWLARHRVDLVVLPRRHNGGLVPALVARAWVVIHADDEALVLVPQRPDTADLIKREGYDWLWGPGKDPATPEEAAQLLDEANRALRHCPPGSAFAWFSKASALRVLGFHDEADAADRKVSALTKGM